jgi:predicted transcriptional regulator YheO
VGLLDPIEKLHGCILPSTRVELDVKSNLDYEEIPVTPPPLLAYAAVADGLVALLQPFAEAVIHDLASDRVVHVSGGFSPREVGDPSDLREVAFASDASVIGPYEKTNFDGRRIKSISVVLRDAEARPIGLLCINVDVTAFAETRRLLQAFLAPPEPLAEVQAEFRDDWHERVNRFIAAWTAEHAVSLDRLDRAGRDALIRALHASGGFQGPRAAAYVARLLGVSRATVYNTLTRLKSESA